MQRIIQKNIDKYQTFKSKCGFYCKNNLFTIKIITYVLYQKLHIIKARKLYETIKMLKTTMYCVELTWTFKKYILH